MVKANIYLNESSDFVEVLRANHYNYSVKYNICNVFILVVSDLLLSKLVKSVPRRDTVKFLNFRTPENFAVIYLKFKQRGQTLVCFIKKMQME